MSQMPDDYDDEDNEVVSCYTTKEFREAVEKTPDDTMIYLRGEGQFSVPNVDRLPQHIVATDEVVLRGGLPDLHLNVHSNAKVFLNQAKYVWASTRGVCSVNNADAVHVLDSTELFASDCGVVHAGERSQVETFACGRVLALGRARVTLHGKSYCMAFERADVDVNIHADCTVEAHDFSRVHAAAGLRLAYRSPSAMVTTPHGEDDTLPFIGNTVEEWAHTYDAPIDLWKNRLYVYKYVERNEETGDLETGRLRGSPVQWKVGRRTECADWNHSRVSYHGLHFASHPVRAAMMVVRSGERHMLRCAIPVDKTVIMGGGNSVKAPWADVVEEVEFDWRQVP